MERNLKFVLGFGFVLLVILGIGIYAYRQSIEYIRGPQILINEPKDGSAFIHAPILISGNAQNTSQITLNDSPISIDSRGNFNQKILLMPGYNIITIRAQDRFGKKVQKTLELVYKEAPKEVTASSTPLVN